MQCLQLPVCLFVFNALLFLVVSIVVANLLIVAHQQVEDYTNYEANAATTSENEASVSSACRRKHSFL